MWRSRSLPRRAARRAECVGFSFPDPLAGSGASNLGPGWAWGCESQDGSEQPKAEGGPCAQTYSRTSGTLRAFVPTLSGEKANIFAVSLHLKAQLPWGPPTTTRCTDHPWSTMDRGLRRHGCPKQSLVHDGPRIATTWMSKAIPGPRWTEDRDGHGWPKANDRTGALGTTFGLAHTDIDMS